MNINNFMPKNRKINVDFYVTDGRLSITNLKNLKINYPKKIKLNKKGTQYE